MGQTVDRACDKYELKLKQGGLPLRPGISVEQQAAHYRVALMQQRHLTVESAQVLGKHDVQSIYWVGYYGFVRKLDRYVRRGLGGLSLRLEAGLLIDYWVGRGLRRDVLVALCVGVLEIEPEPGGWTETGTSLK